MKRILIVGDAILDRHWYCTPKGVSPEAPVLAWDVDRIVDAPGGAANVACNLQNLLDIYEIDATITFACEVSDELRSALPENFPYIKRRFLTGRKPTVKNRIIFERPHQQITRFDQDGQISLAYEMNYTQRLVEFIRESKWDIGIASDYAHGGVNRKVLEAMRTSCSEVIIDPKGTSYDKYTGLVNTITPNLKELYDLAPSGEDDLSKAKSLGWALKRTACPQNTVNVILKRGDKGCILARDDKDPVNIEAYRTERQVIDPTGAGDTFIAGLALCRAQGIDLIIAAEIANRLAGISVTYPNCWVPEQKHVLI